MFLFGLVGGSQAFDPLILLVMAFGVEAGLGAFPSVFGLTAYPLALLAGRSTRSRQAEPGKAQRNGPGVARCRFRHGGLRGGGGTGMGYCLARQNHDFGWIVELTLLTTMIDQGRRYVRVRGIAVAFAEGNLEAARRSLGELVARDPGRMTIMAWPAPPSNRRPKGFVPASWRRPSGMHCSVSRSGGVPGGGGDGQRAGPPHGPVPGLRHGGGSAQRHPGLDSGASCRPVSGIGGHLRADRAARPGGSGDVARSRPPPVR